MSLLCCEPDAVTAKSLRLEAPLYLILLMMKLTSLLSVVAVGTLALSNLASAAGPKTYQVTGPVLEATDSMIAVQKGKDRWEIARDSNTKVTGDLKVGAKVTITYTMTATEAEVKAGKEGKAAPPKKP